MNAHTPVAAADERPSLPLGGLDVLGLGCVAVDDLLYVGAYPPADAKTPVLRRDRQGGGLTATALVAAARLGARCAYAGVLDTDELSRFVLEGFTREGIDISCVVRRPGARPVASTIVVDERRGSRNIFYDLTGAQGAADHQPHEELIAGSRVLLVDHFGIPGMTRAAAIARRAGSCVVADFERDELPGFAGLLEWVDHLIVSEDFAKRMTGAGSPERAVAGLWHPRCKTVVVTAGEAGCWYQGAPDAPPCHQPAFKVDAVDTTGCGDVFHGAYAAALARGLPLSERIRFAAAVAALKATVPGGQAGIPRLAAVEAFLARHP